VSEGINPTTTGTYVFKDEVTSTYTPSVRAGGTKAAPSPGLELCQEEQIEQGGSEYQTAGVRAEGRAFVRRGRTRENDPATRHLHNPARSPPPSPWQRHLGVRAAEETKKNGMPLLCNCSLSPGCSDSPDQAEESVVRRPGRSENNSPQRCPEVISMLQ
jgi:hypothetical protein